MYIIITRVYINDFITASVNLHRENIMQQQSKVNPYYMYMHVYSCIHYNIVYLHVPIL